MRLGSALLVFLGDTRGNATLRVAGAAFAVSFIAVMGAMTFDRAARNGGLMRVASVFGAKSASQYDYAPVGAIPAITARNVILDPCLGVPK